MLKSKEATIRSYLLKEAFHKREFNKRKFVHSYLLNESEEILNDLNKEAMARSSGGSTLKNSGWNTNWGFADPSKRISAIQEEIENTFGHYFHAVLNGRQYPIKSGITVSNDKIIPGADVDPGSIYFRFKYYRSIIPIAGENLESQKAHVKAINAIEVLDKYLPGFKQFQEDIQSLNISLKPFCHVSEFNPSDGGLSHEGLSKFINSQREKYYDNSYYIDHLNELSQTGKIRFTQRSPKYRMFSNKDVKNIGTVTSLISAIENKTSAGYTIDQSELSNTIHKLLEERLQLHNLDRNSSDSKVQGYIKTYQSFYEDMYQELINWYSKYKSTGKISKSQELTTQDARLILSHLTVPTVSSPKIRPDEFSLKMSIPHISNGWDSSSRNPEDIVKTLPPLRQLPNGEVVHDRGNGNMSYDHLVLNWNGGLDGFIKSWGDRCDEWLQSLPGIMRNIAQESPEAADAINNVLNNSTGAEGLRTVLSQYGDFASFKNNHLDKSLYSEISTVSSIKRNLTKTPSQIVVPSSSDIQTIKTSIMKQVNKIGKDIIIAAKTNSESAGVMLDNLQSDLVKLYLKNDIDWDFLTLGLKGLNSVKKSYGIVASLKNNIGDQRQEEKNTKLNDEAGFMLLKQFGYALAKIMDLLSATMIRSCEEVVNTRIDGKTEKFYGHQYSASSGKSEGGEIILSVRYAYAPPELTKNKDIQKKIRHEQSRRHVRAKDVLQRQTLYPQHADPTGRFTDPNDPKTEVGEFTPMPGEEKPVVKIVENVEYFLGQAAGKSRFAKTIRHGLPWRQMIDVFMQRYPDIGSQLGVIFEPMNANLEKLELASKRAIDKVRGDFEVLYVDNDGAETVLSSDTLNAESIRDGADVSEQDLISNTPETNVPPQTTTPQPSKEWSHTYNEIVPGNYPNEEPDIIDDRNFNNPVNSNENMVSNIEEKKPMVNAPMSIKGPIPGSIAPEPTPSFIRKPQNKRKLIRDTPRRMSSIEERLQRVANKLDSHGLSELADKIDIILHKLYET